MNITVEYDCDSDQYVLMVSDGRLRPAPAGARLFRAEPWPVIQFSHATKEAAERDATTLRKYLAGMTTKKTGKKTDSQNWA
jgi:hypothetical protein